MPEPPEGQPLDENPVVVLDAPAPQTRLPLSRERIVGAAVSFIEERGLAGLSMRRLAKTLDVEAMSLYRYLPSREDLLDGVVDEIIDGMYADPAVALEPNGGWQDYLQRLAHGVRRVALAHPRAFPLIASRPPEAPWLRPPLRNLRWVESFLDGLIRDGFDEKAAVMAYRAFTSMLLGHLLLEVSALGADIGPLDVLDDGTAENPGLAGYPRIRALSSSLAEDHSAAEFEESLENLLNRLTLLRSEALHED